MVSKLEIEERFISAENNFLYQNLDEISKDEAIELIQEGLDGLDKNSKITWVEFPHWKYALKENTDVSKAIGKWWILGGKHEENIEKLADCEFLEYAKVPVKKMGVTCFYCSEENILNLAEKLKEILPEERWDKVKFKYDSDTLKGNEGNKSKMKLSEV